MIKKWLWDCLMDKALQQQAFSNKARIIAEDMEATSKSLEHNVMAHNRFLRGSINANRIAIKHAKHASFWARCAKLFKE